MSLNFKLLVNLPTENESCILNVCQFQFFSSVMNSSRPVTHWDQDDFFPLPCISISAERKREKLWNMVTFLFIADHFPVALDNWLFVQVSCLSLPVLQAITRLFWNLRLQNQVGNLHTITTCLQSPFWKSLQQKQIYPAPPFPSKANIPYGRQIRQKFIYSCLAESPVPPLKANIFPGVFGISREVPKLRDRSKLFYIRLRLRVRKVERSNSGQC